MRREGGRGGGRTFGGQGERKIMGGWIRWKGGGSRWVDETEENRDKERRKEVDNLSLTKGVK